MQKSNEESNTEWVGRSVQSNIMIAAGPLTMVMSIAVMMLSKNWVWSAFGLIGYSVGLIFLFVAIVKPSHVQKFLDFLCFKSESMYADTSVLTWSKSEPKYITGCNLAHPFRWQFKINGQVVLPESIQYTHPEEIQDLYARLVKEKDFKPVSNWTKVYQKDDSENTNAEEAESES